MTSVYPQISSYLARRVGIDMTHVHLSAFRAFVEKRMAALSHRSEAEYIDHLTTRVEEFQALVELVTVRETYFYRDLSQMEALHKQILPELFAACDAAGGIPMRTWSVGCCTGEEPYTLAIMASELGRLRNFDVVASDVNERSLGIARLL